MTCESLARFFASVQRNVARISNCATRQILSHDSFRTSSSTKLGPIHVRNLVSQTQDWGQVDLTANCMSAIRTHSNQTPDWGRARSKGKRVSSHRKSRDDDPSFDQWDHDVFTRGFVVTSYRVIRFDLLNSESFRMNITVLSRSGLIEVLDVLTFMPRAV
jgi:hypothetical protein